MKKLVVISSLAILLFSVALVVNAKTADNLTVTTELTVKDKDKDKKGEEKAEAKKADAKSEKKAKGKECEKTCSSKEKSSCGSK